MTLPAIHIKKLNATLITILLILVINFFFLFPLLKSQIILRSGGGDNVAHFYPYQEYLSKILRNPDKISSLLWSHELSFGFPLHADPQTTLFYPFTILFLLLLPFPMSSLAWFLFHQLVMFTSTYYLGRTLKFSRLTAMTVSVVFSFCNTVTDFYDFLPVFAAICWFPLLFLIIEQCFQKEKPEILLLLPFVYTFQLLCSVQIAVFSLPALMLLFFVRIFQKSKLDKGPQIIKSSTKFFILVFISVLLASIQILPTILFSTLSPRLKAGIDFVLQDSLSPLSFLTLFLPQTFKTLPITPVQSIYFGLIPFLLAFIPFLDLKNKEAKPYLILTPLLLLFSLGKFGVIYYLVGQLPLFKLFRHPCFYSFAFSLGAAILSGFGLEKIIFLKEEKLTLIKKFRNLGLTLFVCALSCIILVNAICLVKGEAFLQIAKNYVRNRFHQGQLTAYPLKVYLQRVEKIYQTLWAKLQLSSPQVFTFILLFSVFLIVLSLAYKKILKGPHLSFLLSFLILFDLWLQTNIPPTINPISTSDYQRATPIIRFLKKDSDVYRIYSWPSRQYRQKLLFEEFETRKPIKLYNFYLNTLQPNLNLRFGFSEIDSLIPPYLERNHLLTDFLESRNSPASDTEALKKMDQFSSLLGCLNVKYLLVEPYQVKLNGFKKVFQSGETTIYENKNFLPRFFLVQDYEVARNEKEAFKLITSKNFDFRRKVILEKKPDFLLGNSRYSEGKIKINKYRPTYVELSLSLKTPSILVFSELYYPEWKAYVNGKETEIYRANFLSRAILLKEGNQKVIFKYHPTSLIRGSLVSGVTCFAYLLAILYFIKKPKLKLKISANN